MKHCNIFFLSLLGALLLASCFDDEGNYDYIDINEISIKGFGDKDTVYQLLYLADTLRIYPEIRGTIDTICEDENYEYLWEMGNILGQERQVLARTRNLILPIDIRPGTYSLFYRVKEKASGLVTLSSGAMNIATSYTKGYLVLGDRPDGTVQLDMVAINDARNDTTLLRNMLEGSGLPEMRNGTHVCHTGDSYRTDGILLWVMSETGSYYMDGSNMTGSASNTVNSMYYTSLDVDPDAVPVLEFPQIASGRESGRASGIDRGYLMSDGSILKCNTIMGEYYGNPLNRVSSDPEHLIDVFPYVFYAPGSLSVIAAYDRENERFLVTSNSFASTMKALKDQATDPFPWNQGETGRTLIHGDNTRNTLGGSSYGRSYALMKDKEDNYFVYAFYADKYMGYGYPSAKKGFWKINKAYAPQIDQATKFLFSSARTLLYYVVGNKIYCHDYTSGNERYEIVADFGEDEITWLNVDYWTEQDFSRILVATYNTAEGGTLRKFSESTDQNTLNWTEEKRSIWGGFPRIKCVNWRNSAY